MKTIITSLLILLVFVSCKDQKDTNTTIAKTDINKHTLVGVWEMKGYYNYNNNKIVDSFLSSDQYRQIKIYTPTKIMWSRLNTLDSTDWFGYGDYKTTDSTLTETISYGSNSMNKVIKNSNTFNFELVLNENTFYQIELDENGDRILSENYKRIE